MTTLPFDVAVLPLKSDGKNRESIFFVFKFNIVDVPVLGGFRDFPDQKSHGSKPSPESTSGTVHPLYSSP
ncbi:MAG: hypothetical protein AB4063_24525 [Crocosphaera sp.]